jgi:hypothetical protein
MPALDAWSTVIWFVSLRDINVLAKLAAAAAFVAVIEQCDKPVTPGILTISEVVALVVKDAGITRTWFGPPGIPFIEGVDK